MHPAAGGLSRKLQTQMAWRELIPPWRCTPVERAALICVCRWIGRWVDGRMGGAGVCLGRAAYGRVNV